MKSLLLSHEEWDRIYNQIKEEYADNPSVYLIRSKMIKELGFVNREHRGDTYNLSTLTVKDWRDSYSQIYIDFFSDQAQSFFMLKYMK